MPNDDEGPPDVRITCPECGTTTHVPLPDVAGALARHNERMHDGEEVATVDPTLKDRLADLVADELGLLDSDGR